MSQFISNLITQTIISPENARNRSRDTQKFGIQVCGLTGVQRETFEKMVEILVKTQNERYWRAGRKGGLSIKDKLLIALEYTF